MSSLLPPNPCLLAILLVVNYHVQPRIAFHYPPKPGEDNSLFRTYLSQDLDDDSSSSSDDESASSSENKSTVGNPNGESRDGQTNDDGKPEMDIEETGSASPEKFDAVTLMHTRPRWDDILGYNASYLAKLLSPEPSAHKRRFEWTLNDKAFLGWPVFARDGRWRREKRQKISRNPEGKNAENVLEHEISRGGKPNLSRQGHEDHEDTSGQDTDTNSRMKPKEHKKDIKIETEATDFQSGYFSDYENRQNDIEGDYKDTLEMFHVVFVLDPPPLEYHLRMNDMYKNVVKKFSQALKWEQSRTLYVSKEISKISHADWSVGRSGSLH